MARTTPKTRHLPKPLILTAGPFVGCRDATDPTTADPQFARLLRNLRRGNGPNGVAQVGRPGTSAMGGSYGVTVQGVLTWTDVTGTRLTTIVADGEVYTYDWDTATKTKVVSTANLATASAALSTTERVALVPFADQLVISDGVNFALWWDGTSGAGGITELPVKFYGPPTVYYSKLCGIDATRRQTLFWSEEGDATIGYDITVGPSTYTNAWDNPGGYTDPLTAVCGTNDGLYVFRERVSVAILGAMSANFQTAGTRANLSPEIGTLSPFSVLEVTSGVLLVDADAQPWLMKIGASQPLPLWKDCQVTLRDVPRLSLPQATTIYSEADGVVVIGLAPVGFLNPAKWLTFHADDLQYNGPWTGWAEASCAGPVVDQFGVKRWAHGEVVGGRVVAHDDPQVSVWNDTVLGQTQAIAHEAIGPYLGFDLMQDFRVNQAEFGFTLGSSATVSYQTSRGYGSSAAIAIGSASGDTAYYGTAVYGAATFGVPVTSSQATVGLAGQGRWVSLIVRHEASGEPFGLDVQRARVGTGPGNPLQP